METMLRRIILVLLLLVGNIIGISAQDAKSLAQKGWIVESGTKSVEEQLRQVVLATQDTTVIVAHGYNVADTYHEAYCKAYIKALHDAARQTHYVTWSSNQENLNSGNIDICGGSESTDLLLFIKQELSESESNNKWSACSEVNINGECCKVTPGSCIESSWHSIVKIESVQILKSIYRHNQNGKIEIELSLKIPRINTQF